LKKGDLIQRIRCDTDIRRASREYTTGLVLEVIEGRSKGKTKLYARVLWSAGHHDVWAVNCLEVISGS
jgi:hypothetical protein